MRFTVLGIRRQTAAADRPARRPSLRVIKMAFSNSATERWTVDHSRAAARWVVDGHDGIVSSVHRNSRIVVGRDARRGFIGFEGSGLAIAARIPRQSCRPN